MGGFVLESYQRMLACTEWAALGGPALGDRASGEKAK
jgi:hypothetical protein